MIGSTTLIVRRFRTGKQWVLKRGRDKGVGKEKEKEEEGRMG